jgi:hypothetical protein
MPPVSHMAVHVPAAWDLGNRLRAALERLKPILIDLILVQMGWPTIGLKTGLKDLIVCCFALCFAQWGLLKGLG